MVSVSVIIPIYNTEAYLEQCLNSVIQQTFKDIEIICILDGSTDQSGLIVKKYAELDHRIIIIEQPNSGLSAARNAGLNIASGEFISFIDSDDWVANDFIEKMYDTALATDAGMVICNYHYFRKEAMPSHALPQGVHDSIEICRALVKDDLFSNYAWNKLIKRDIFTKHQILFPVGLVFEDIAILCKIAYYSGKVAVINEYIYFYRSREGSILNTYNSALFLDIFVALGEMKSFLISQNLFSTCRIEFEYNCIHKLIYSAKHICKHSQHLMYLIPEIKKRFRFLLDKKRKISPNTKQLLSVHKKLALKFILFNHNVYRILAVRKLL